MKYLSEKEAYDVALNLEEEGINFYESCADKSKNAESRHIFRQLASEEREHFDTFKKLQNALGVTLNKPLGQNEEVRQYLANLVRPGIFYDLKSIPSESLAALTEYEAIHIGIQTEKDSILFYTETWQNSVNSKGKKAFKKIILEERRHLNILIERLMNLEKLKK
ncbi:MAG: ferritin family protein [bacterium]|nr:ferritin family protein [bacterium]MDD5756407.1 ferritin family protein [bacterium]